MLLPDTLGGLVAADGQGVLPKLITKKNGTRLSLQHNNYVAVTVGS